MSDPDDEPPPTPEEMAAARRLAALVDGEDPGPGSPDEAELAARAEVVRALGPGTDDVAGLARVRAGLLGRGRGRAAPARHWRRAAGLAAAFVLGVGLGRLSAPAGAEPTATAGPSPGLRIPRLRPPTPWGARPRFAALPPRPGARALLDQVARRPVRRSP